MGKITVVSEKEQGEHYGTIKILSMDVLPSHTKELAGQPKKYTRSR
jgi:hypothetical protein